MINKYIQIKYLLSKKNKIYLVFLGPSIKLEAYNSNVGERRLALDTADAWAVNDGNVDVSLEAPRGTP